MTLLSFLLFFQKVYTGLVSFYRKCFNQYYRCILGDWAINIPSAFQTLEGDQLGSHDKRCLFPLLLTLYNLMLIQDSTFARISESNVHPPENAHAHCRLKLFSFISTDKAFFWTLESEWTHSVPSHTSYVQHSTSSVGTHASKGCTMINSPKQYISAWH